MKKALAILLALSVLALSACAAKQANSDTQKDSNTAETEQLSLIHIFRRKSGAVRFGASGDPVEYIDKLAQLCSGLSAEGIRSFRIRCV